MKTTNYTDLRNNLKSYLDLVVENSEALIIHCSNNNSVVVISLDEYNALKESEYIMSSRQTMEELRKGEADLQNGKGSEVDINETEDYIMYSGGRKVI